MSKARQQSITRRTKRVGKCSNITGIVIKNTVTSTKITKSAKSLPTVIRAKKFVVLLPKKEIQRRDHLAKRRLKERKEKAA